MLNRGSRVMLADIDADQLQSAAADLRATGGDVGTTVCDVTDVESVRSAAATTVEQFKRVHIVVNNAGVSVGGVAGTIPLEDWAWVVNTNLMGVIHGVEVFTPLLRQQGEGGYFINTASMAGHWANPYAAPYNATKFAVVGYTETLRTELAAENIGASVLCPGWVNTDIYKSHVNRPSSDGGESIDDVAANNPAIKAAMEQVKAGISPNLVGDWVVECVEQRRLYIFTHPEMKAAIDARIQTLQQDYEACINDPRFTNKELPS